MAGVYLDGLPFGSFLPGFLVGLFGFDLPFFLGALGMLRFLARATPRQCVEVVPSGLECLFDREGIGPSPSCWLLCVRELSSGTFKPFPEDLDVFAHHPLLGVEQVLVFAWQLREGVGRHESIELG